MSPQAAPRQKLSEYFLEIRLTKAKHIVVEGRTDQNFIQAWLDDLGEAASRAAVVTVDSLEVPTTDVLAHGLTDGNRGRVIVVAAKASEGGIDLRCVADRDCGHDVATHNYETLLWTDYPAMESYAVDARTLDKANLLSFGGHLPSAGQLLGQLAFALSELFAVRRQHQFLPNPDYKAGLRDRRATLDQFDVAAAVSVEVRPLVAGYERPSGKDPREFAYGHDIGELLLAAYGNELRNRAGLMGLKAVEGALRSAIQAAGTYVDERLFVLLREWIGAVTD